MPIICSLKLKLLIAEEYMASIHKPHQISKSFLQIFSMRKKSYHKCYSNEYLMVNTMLVCAVSPQMDSSTERRCV